MARMMAHRAARVEGGTVFTHAVCADCGCARLESLSEGPHAEQRAQTATRGVDDTDDGSERTSRMVAHRENDDGAARGADGGAQYGESGNDDARCYRRRA
ncbi:hypothetical protein EXIGLDRAFT_442085 [Exidia glandulosa HHB12029]|uniref:Uncharacterized protein n=1 Tax=Exidia glandulosa HHB12029 TaxID=1314781 RepID=A0A165KBI4_EXIGL|nr:hypothetical protein EXIGLDRAFT_442085 [Exidia glandulosa HHB12029]